MTVDLILKKLKGASSTKDVFGDLKGSDDELLDAIKSIYNQMAKLVHPDIAGSDKNAETAFKLLNDFVERAREEVSHGEFGKEKEVIVRSKKNKYTIIGKPIAGDIANIYFTKENSILKIAKEPKLNKYLENEAALLKKIHKQSNDKLQKLADAHIPPLIESFVIDNKQCNVIKKWEVGECYTLDRVNVQYTDGVGGRHCAWMFKRLLAAIAIAHEANVIHGQIIPTNFMVCPADHNGLLIDWTGAVEKNGIINFMVPQFQEFYAPEIWLKQKTSFSTDIYMAAKLMIYILGGNTKNDTVPKETPKLIYDFLRGCLIKNPHRRPQKAFDILDDFSNTLEDVYGKPKWVDLEILK